jgi:dihydroxy-acid dehydratase
VIRPITNALMQDAGFLNLKGNLFDSAIMKTSVISQEFRDRYLSNPDDRDAFEGAPSSSMVPEDYHHRSTIRAWKSTSTASWSCAAPARSCYPGGAEVVNMRPPATC